MYAQKIVEVWIMIRKGWKPMLCVYKLIEIILNTILHYYSRLGSKDATPLLLKWIFLHLGLLYIINIKLRRQTISVKDRNRKENQVALRRFYHSILSYNQCTVSQIVLCSHQHKQNLSRPNSCHYVCET